MGKLSPYQSYTNLSASHDEDTKPGMAESRVLTPKLMERHTATSMTPMAHQNAFVR